MWIKFTEKIQQNDFDIKGCNFIEDLFVVMQMHP